MVEVVEEALESKHQNFTKFFVASPPASPFPSSSPSLSPSSARPSVASHHGFVVVDAVVLVLVFFLRLNLSVINYFF